MHVGSTALHWPPLAQGKVARPNLASGTTNATHWASRASRSSSRSRLAVITLRSQLERAANCSQLAVIAFTVAHVSHR
eukprot:5257567-Prymnesium_polylepis.1